MGSRAALAESDGLQYRLGLSLCSVINDLFAAITEPSDDPGLWMEDQKVDCQRAAKEENGQIGIEAIGHPLGVVEGLLEMGENIG